MPETENENISAESNASNDFETGSITVEKTDILFIALQ